MIGEVRNIMGVPFECVAENSYEARGSLVTSRGGWLNSEDSEGLAWISRSYDLDFHMEVLAVFPNNDMNAMFEYFSNNSDVLVDCKTNEAAREGLRVRCIV